MSKTGQAELRREVDGFLEKEWSKEPESDFEKAKFLLYSVVYGTDEAMIAKEAGIDPETCSMYADLARKNGIWTRGGKVCCEWFEEGHGGMALVLDVAVLSGLVEKTT